VGKSAACERVKVASILKHFEWLIRLERCYISAVLLNIRKVFNDLASSTVIEKDGGDHEEIYE